MDGEEFRERAGALTLEILKILKRSEQLPSYTFDEFHEAAKDTGYAVLLVPAAGFAANFKLPLPNHLLDELLILAEDNQDIELFQDYKTLRAAADA